MENAYDPPRQQANLRTRTLPSQGAAVWQNWLVTAVFVFAMVLIGGILASHLAPNNDQLASATSEARPAAGTEPARTASATPVDSRPGAAKPASRQPPVAAHEKGVRKKPVKTSPAATPAVASAVKSSSAANSPATPDSRPPVKAVAEAKSAPVQSGSQTQSQNPGGAPSQAKVSPPEKKEEPAPPPAADNPAKRQAYAKAVAGVRSALWRRDMAAAKRFFHRAKENQQSPADQTEIDRLDVILDNMDQFWKALSDACGSLQVGDELEIGEDRVAVVECSRDGLMIHMYGRQQRYHIQTLPLPVIKCLVDRSLRATPGSKVIVGTFLAMDKEGDRNRARVLWEDAAKRGESLGRDLLPELKVPSPGER